MQRKRIELPRAHIEPAGIIENGRLKGSVRLLVTLNQTVWLEYKGAGWGDGAREVQIISNGGPYVNGPLFGICTDR